MKIPPLIGIALCVTVILLVLFMQGVFSGSVPPNVVILVMDCVRADHLGSYGYERPTSPQIDSLARRGGLFTRAFSPSPWTLPSVSSILTGCYPATHGAGVPMDDEKFFDLSLSTPVIGPDESLPQMTDLFSAADYMTFFFSSNTLVRKKLFGRRCSDFALKIKAPAGEVVDYGIDRIEKAVKLDRPFFLYLHFMDSHQPLQQPEPYFNFFRHDDTPNSEIHRNWEFDKAEEQQGADYLAYREQKICAYDGSIRYADTEIGRLIASMESMGILENTFIVLLSDHGEALWDHAETEAESYRNPKGTNGIGHGHTLFQELIQVPLIVAGPGIPAGMTVDGPVKIIDLLPTLLEWARLPAPDILEGSSFADLLIDKPSGEPAPIFSEAPAHGTLKTALIHYPFKYIFAHNEDDFLFDLSKDPRERNDLCEDKPSLAKTFLKAIEARRTHYEGANRRTGQAEFLPPEAMEQLRNLGYIK